MVCCVGEGLPGFWRMLHSSSRWRCSQQTWTASRRNNSRNDTAVYRQSALMALRNDRGVALLFARPWVQRPVRSRRPNGIRYQPHFVRATCPHRSVALRPGRGKNSQPAVSSVSHQWRSVPTRGPASRHGRAGGGLKHLIQTAGRLALASTRLRHGLLEYLHRVPRSYVLGTRV